MACITASGTSPRISDGKLPSPSEALSGVFQVQLHNDSQGRTSQQSGTRRKSRLGCKECKVRRVKCDETFPVCRRCLRRGSVCQPAARPSSQWILELPPSLNLPLSVLPHVDKRRLRYWCENASQMLVIDTENNPWSFPILRYLEHSAALVHALESLSIGHEAFFNAASRPAVLASRVQALNALQKELLDHRDVATVPAFLTAYLLGMSASCVDMDDKADFGHEHIIGARAIIDRLISKPGALEDPMNRFLFGVYVFWEMACAILPEPEEQEQINPKIYAGIQQTRHFHHSLVGNSLEIVYMLITVGRYCRSVIDGCPRSLELEEMLQEQILDWDSPHENPHLNTLSHSFRNSAIILLYRICGTLPRESEMMGDDDLQPLTSDAVIRRYAMQVLEELDETPLSSPCLNLHPFPLLTAGSELEAEDVSERQRVRARLKAVYSLNRFPLYLLAVELLEEVWELRDQGLKFSWVEVMLLKRWRLLIS